jgi:outer membrane protein assembly factor BamA
MLRQLLAFAIASSCFAFRATDTRAESDRSDQEFTLVPFVGGNSDVGWGGGYVASLAGIEPSYEPYVYRIESAGSITFQGEGDGLRIPYVDDYFLLTFPHVIKNQLRFEARLSYTREATLKYYGIGNAATIAPGRGASAAYYEYARVHPTLIATSEYRLAGLRVLWGISYAQNWFEIPEDGKLAEDRRSGSERVRSLLRGTDSHGSFFYRVGLGLDTRDNEVSPRRGMYHTARVDFSPGSAATDIATWARLNGALRFYLPLLPPRLVLALRLLADSLVGAAPFYELARFDDTYAIGGVKGVRGVPAQRYHGKIKTFGNFELRSELFEFDLLGGSRRFGVALFADGGRSWADHDFDPELDGRGVGLKYGAGGGLRLASGKSFMLRLDVAWSPDAEPVSAYLMSGHLF